MVEEEEKAHGPQAPHPTAGAPSNIQWAEDWLIIVAQGKTLIGKQSPLLGSPLRISPVFELQPQAQAMPNGQIQIAHLVLPLLLLASIKAIDLPQGAIVVPVTSLSTNEKRGLRLAISNCEEMVASARAQESGIAIAKTMPNHMRKG
jgi:hypothetical protein